MGSENTRCNTGPGAVYPHVGVLAQNLNYKAKFEHLGLTFPQGSLTITGPTLEIVMPPMVGVCFYSEESITGTIDNGGGEVPSVLTLAVTLEKQSEEWFFGGEHKGYSCSKFLSWSGEYTLEREGGGGLYISE